MTKLKKSKLLKTKKYNSCIDKTKKNQTYKARKKQTKLWQN